MLKKGKSKSAISYNVRKEVHSGKKFEQALAIALSVEGKSKKRKNGK